MSSLKRNANLPDVPTVDETVVKGFQADAWFGLFAPARTPNDIIARLNIEMMKALKDPATAEMIVKAGFDITPSNPAELADFVKVEIVKWAKVVKDLGPRRSRLRHECPPACQHPHPGADRRQPRHRPCHGEEFGASGWRDHHHFAKPFSALCPWPGGEKNHVQLDLGDPVELGRGIEEIRHLLDVGGSACAGQQRGDLAQGPERQAARRHGHAVRSLAPVFNINFFAPVRWRAAWSRSSPRRRAAWST